MDTLSARLLAKISAASRLHAVHEIQLLVTQKRLVRHSPERGKVNLSNLDQGLSMAKVVHTQQSLLERLAPERG